jgi:CRP/FNR family transcriptional regulator
VAAAPGAAATAPDGQGIDRWPADPLASLGASAAGPPSMPRLFPTGAFLVMAGTPARAVFLIDRGLVRTYVMDRPGRPTTTALLGPGQIVGVAALVGRPTYHAFAEAVTPVRAWRVCPAVLMAGAACDLRLSDRLLVCLAERLELVEGLIGDVCLRPVRERLGRLEQRLAPCLGGEAPRLTRQQIAELVAARRETVCRAAGGAAARRDRRPGRRRAGPGPGPVLLRPSVTDITPVGPPRRHDRRGVGQARGGA